MELKFTKMHGCGNDYIYINCFKERVSFPHTLSVFLSDRHKAVGGDGLVLIMPSKAADARMRMFNMDGSEGRMCGNAIRCVAKYLYDNDIVKKLNMKIETLSGIRELHLVAENSHVTSVRVNMGAVKAEEIEIDGVKAVYADAGNPHLVLFRDAVDGIDLTAENYEKNRRFPEGINTEFVEIIDGNTLKMRVWERGSSETLACGTGACASVAAAVLKGYCKKNEDIRVILLGGELTIRYTDEAVFMTGECVRVFEGTVEV